MKIVLTGAAGFIGFHTCLSLLKRGNQVVGVDNLNQYYDINLKLDRLKILADFRHFSFHKTDISNAEETEKIFKLERPDRVIHLAAQAGVRYSTKNPQAFGQSNLIGFLNVLESCNKTNVEHLVYASSSSVYGANTNLPFDTDQRTDSPLSLYAATKKANELMAYAYSAQYGIRTTGLRFFTVYGPWGRPDMAVFSFTKAILTGENIQIFNYGNMKRDFTYIDDIVEGMLNIFEWNQNSKKTCSGLLINDLHESPKSKIYNIGNNKPVPILHLIDCLEKQLGRKANLQLAPLQKGDLIETCAEITELQKATGFTPSTTIEEGIKNFVHWYKAYYKV